MLKILHTGDLHLDSPLSSLEPSLAEKARDSHRRVFEKMMNYARQENIDIILISGDLFDSRYVTAHTKELVIKLFAEFSKPIVISPGNHDPYSLVPMYRGGVLPENVYVFSSEELQRFDFEELDVSVYGYAFVTPSLEHSPLASYSYGIMGNTTRLLCAHADINSPISKYAPVTVADIEKFDFDYAALGHVHNPQKINSDKALINYCGFLFGRSFDELGEGGAYVVTITEGKTTADRVSFSEHTFLREELNLSGVSDINGIFKRISEFIRERGYGKNTSLRLYLIGTVPLDLVISEKALERQNSELFELQIRDLTTHLPDSDFLKSDPSLRGELYRTLLPKLNSDDPEERKRASEALLLGLSAIDGVNISTILGIDGDTLSGGVL